MSSFEMSEEILKSVRKSVTEIFGEADLADTIFELIMKARRNISDADADLENYVNIVIEHMKGDSE